VVDNAACTRNKCECDVMRCLQSTIKFQTARLLMRCALLELLVISYPIMIYWIKLIAQQTRLCNAYINSIGAIHVNQRKLLDRTICTVEETKF